MGIDSLYAASIRLSGTRDLMNSIRKENDDFIKSFKLFTGDEEIEKDVGQTIESIQNSSEEIYEEISKYPIDEQAMRICDGLIISIAEMEETNEQHGMNQTAGSGLKIKNREIKKNIEKLGEKGWCYMYQKFIEQGETPEDAKGYIQELQIAKRNKTGVNWVLVKAKYYTRWFLTKLIISCAILMTISYFSGTIQTYWGELSRTIGKSLTPLRTKFIGLYGKTIEPFIGIPGKLPDNQGWIQYFTSFVTDKTTELMILTHVGLTNISKLAFIPLYYGFKFFNIGFEGVSWVMNGIAGYSGLIWFGSIGLMGVSILILILTELPQYFLSKFDPSECEEL